MACTFGLVWRLACAAALGVTMTLAASAAPYPTRPIEMIVGYAPGGSVDVVARAVVQGMSEKLGQSIVVLNKPGAGGIVGLNAAANAEPDGYTLFMGFSTELVIVPQISPAQKPVVARLMPIAMAGTLPQVMNVANKLNVTTPSQLVDLARREPGRHTYGGSIASTSQIGAEWFASVNKLVLLHVPYRGGAQGLTDVIGGHLDMFISGLAASKPAVDSGSLKAVGVMGERRLAALPSVPTFKEAGMDLDLASWVMLLAPKGTPNDIAQLLKTTMDEVVASEKIQGFLAEQGVDPTPRDAGAFLASEDEKFARLVKDLNIKMEK